MFFLQPFSINLSIHPQVFFCHLRNPFLRFSFLPIRPSRLHFLAKKMFGSAKYKLMKCNINEFTQIQHFICFNITEGADLNPLPIQKPAPIHNPVQTRHYLTLIHLPVEFTCFLLSLIYFSVYKPAHSPQISLQYLVVSDCVSVICSV